MDDLQSFCLSIPFAKKEDIYLERTSLLKAIDGELFYPLRMWPQWTRRIFWRKPITDKETFTITLFLFGNGCPPQIIIKWIITSQYWASQSKKTAIKRFKQIKWILAK
jgi:hypothetical protein